MIVVKDVNYLEPEDIKDPMIAAHMEAVKEQAMEDVRPVLVKSGFEVTQKELAFLKSVAAREEVSLNRVIRAIIKRWIEAQHYSYPVGLIADRPEDVVEMDFSADDDDPKDYADDVVGGSHE